MGHTSSAKDIRLLEHNLRNSAREIHMVPGLSDISFVSVGKLADAEYVLIFDKDEVNIYDMNNIEITASRSTILKGRRSKHTDL